MITQTLVWTVLPDPSAPISPDGTTLLTVRISPRLSNDENDAGFAVMPLASYPDLANWPEVPLALAIELAGPAGVASIPATIVDDPDAELWRALFPPDLPVVPFRFDAAVAGTPILSFPTEPVLISLAEQYSEQLGPLDGLEPLQGGTVADGPTSPDPWERVDRLIRTVGDGASPLAVSGPIERILVDGVAPDRLDDDPAGWTRLAEFHRPAVEALVGDEDAEGPRHRRSAGPEFHRAVAGLADHPALLARLGLTRRVRVTLPAGLGGSLTIRAVPSHGRALSDYRPHTRCAVEDGRLALEGTDGPPAALHLRLDDATRYRAIDVDVDAAGLALQSLVSTLARAPRTGPPPPLRLPALRSDGIFVAEADRQVSFQDALRRAAEEVDADLAAGGDGSNIAFHADDVLRGYRVDVFDEGSGRWYALCRRVGTYQVGGVAELLSVDDEGTVCDVLAQSRVGGQAVNKLHQALFRWNGWSLVAPPPGAMLGIDDQTVEPVPPADPSSPFAFTVTPAPGTLPSLRYGRSYRFRARVVDIAGQSVPFSPEPDGSPATPSIRYHRYEPVPSPVVVPRRPVTDGESAAVMVVRTDNLDASNPAPGPTCERHLLAPKAAVLTLERHGVLDVEGEHRLDPDAFDLLFERDRGEVTGTPDPRAGSTPFVDVDTMDLPWLPDPFARGIALHGLPGEPDLRVEWPQGSAASWHERLPLRLVLTPGQAGTGTTVQVDRERRVVQVALEPGGEHEIHLSSHLHPGDEEVMGPWRFFAEAAGRAGDDITVRRSEAVAGKLGQITPACPLRLVHAARCPEAAPALGEPRVLRGPDETSCVVSDQAVGVHRPTTLSVHIEAKWIETVDDPLQPAPVHVDGRAVLQPRGQDLVAGWEAPATGRTMAFQAEYDFGDTRHRILECTPVATSRFAAYFTERRIVTLVGTDRVRVAEGFVPGTVVVRAVVPPRLRADDPSEPGRTFSVDHDIAVDDQAGTVARRPDGAVPDGAQVEVAFVAPPVTRAGDPVALSIPATARPAPPMVHSIVPAYAWSEQRDGGTIISTRRGGLLRVFLERPWFTSGEGELLAVLVVDEDLQQVEPASPFSETLAQTRRFVSSVPGDPTALGGVSESLRRSSFPRAVADRVVRVPGLRDSNPSFAANPLFRIRALGHRVEFDERRGLWFSDIEVLLGHNFVRLKLARLQPRAVPLGPTAPFEDLHVSPIVDAGFHHLPADRAAIVVIDGDRANVTVTGTASDGELTATVQVGGPAIGDPLVWEGMDQLPQVPLVRDPIAVGIAQWSGVVALPATPGTVPMRLLIREHQRLPGDPRSEEPVGRLTYFDILEL